MTIRLIDDQVFEGTEADVTVVRLALEREGIRTEVRTTATRIRLCGAVYVRDRKDLERARAVVARHLKGSLPSEAVLAQPWHCRSCGELIEGQFEECWNCGATKR
jgi:hypothetical protein